MRTIGPCPALAVAWSETSVLSRLASGAASITITPSVMEGGMTSGLAETPGRKLVQVESHGPGETLASADADEERHAAARADVDHVRVARDGEVRTGRLGQEHVGQRLASARVEIRDLDRKESRRRGPSTRSARPCPFPACRPLRSERPPWRPASRRTGSHSEPARRAIDLERVH